VSWYDNKPYILEANTYYWHGFFGNGTQRYKKACQYAWEVYNWLIEKFPNRVSISGNKVYLDDVKVFSISSSRANVYKQQNLRYIKKCLKDLEENE